MDFIPGIEPTKLASFLQFFTELADKLCAEPLEKCFEAVKSSISSRIFGLRASRKNSLTLSKS